MTASTMKYPSLAMGLVLISAAAAVGQTAPTPPAASTNEEPVVLSQVLVTGSYLPDRPNTSTKPVQVIGPDQMADSGVAMDLAEILRKTDPEFTGNGNLGLENAGSEAFVTQGGSFLQIHNLKTLVLFNGRRVAFDPAEAALGVEFVDINMIPPSAVDQIEIVTEGTSALYGSDAVGGVINIIL